LGAEIRHRSLPTLFVKEQMFGCPGRPPDISIQSSFRRASMSMRLSKMAECGAKTPQKFKFFDRNQHGSRRLRAHGKESEIKHLSCLTVLNFGSESPAFKTR
jgi:hypothetical protein